MPSELVMKYNRRILHRGQTHVCAVSGCPSTRTSAACVFRVDDPQKVLVFTALCLTHNHPMFQGSYALKSDADLVRESDLKELDD